MLLPTKHVPPSHSLLGVGAVVLGELDGGGRTLTALWHALRKNPTVGSLARLVLALDLLYAIGAVNWVDGVVRRNST